MARPLARRAHAGLPEWIPPQLTQLVDAAPEGDQWLHEIKFDGYRMHARLDRGALRLLTAIPFLLVRSGCGCARVLYSYADKRSLPPCVLPVEER